MVKFSTWWGGCLLYLLLPVLSVARETGEYTGKPDSDLIVAIVKRDTVRVKRLIRAGARVHPDKTKTVHPLMIAAEFGPLETVQSLVRAGAKINERDDMGGTALMTAASHQQVAIVSYLLKQGADPKVKPRNGRTALWWAKQGLEHGSPGRVGKVYESEKRDFQMIIRLLQATGAKE